MPTSLTEPYSVSGFLLVTGLANTWEASSLACTLKAVGNIPSYGVIYFLILEHSVHWEVKEEAVASCIIVCRHVCVYVYVHAHTHTHTLDTFSNFEERVVRNDLR